MTLYTAFWGWLACLVLALALTLTITIIAAMFQGRKWFKANLPGWIILVAVTPLIYMAGLYLLQIAGQTP